VWGVPKYPFSSLLPPEMARTRACRGKPLLNFMPMGDVLVEGKW